MTCGKEENKLEMAASMFPLLHTSSIQQDPNQRKKRKKEIEIDA